MTFRRKALRWSDNFHLVTAHWSQKETVTPEPSRPVSLSGAGAPLGSALPWDPVRAITRPRGCCAEVPASRAGREVCGPPRVTSQSTPPGAVPPRRAARGAKASADVLQGDPRTLRRPDLASSPETACRERPGRGERAADKGQLFLWRMGETAARLGPKGAPQGCHLPVGVSQGPGWSYFHGQCPAQGPGKINAGVQ